VISTLILLTLLVCWIYTLFRDDTPRYIPVYLELRTIPAPAPVVDIATRADLQHNAWMSGDRSVGMFGDYPPTSMEDS